MTLLDCLDFTFGFCQEKKIAKGEDSWCYSFNEQAGLLGVFDGCGGSGAKIYQRLHSHTGAYLASRTVSNAVMRWFERACEGNGLSNAALEAQISESLNACSAQAGQTATKLRSKLSRELPTTAAIWVVNMEGPCINATSISAGDSRTYLLDERGLMQVSVDDLRGEDAMSDLYNSAPMTNVISAKQPIKLNYSAYTLTKPGILLAATDGCFGYLRSPMEFEYLLLNTLMQSKSPHQWHQIISHEIESIAGDDQSMAVAAFSYGSFTRMQQALSPRYNTLKIIVQGFDDELQCRNQAWESYKSGYYQLAEGGVPAVER